MHTVKRLLTVVYFVYCSGPALENIGVYNTDNPSGNTLFATCSLKWFMKFSVPTKLKNVACLTPCIVQISVIIIIIMALLKQAH